MVLLQPVSFADAEGVDHEGAHAGGSAVIACLQWASSSSWDGRCAVAAFCDTLGEARGTVAGAFLIGPVASQTRKAMPKLRGLMPTHHYKREPGHQMDSQAAGKRMILLYLLT